MGWCSAIGVFSASWLFARVGVVRMPASLRTVHLLGVSVSAGVGFTVAMFVANPAFPGESAFVESAKLGIIVGSVVAEALGFLMLMLIP